MKVQVLQNQGGWESQRRNSREVRSDNECSKAWLVQQPCALDLCRSYCCSCPRETPRDSKLMNVLRSCLWRAMYQDPGSVVFANTPPSAMDLTNSGELSPRTQWGGGASSIFCMVDRLRSSLKQTVRTSNDW